MPKFIKGVLGLLCGMILIVLILPISATSAPDWDSSYIEVDSVKDCERGCKEDRKACDGVCKRDCENQFGKDKKGRKSCEDPCKRDCRDTENNCKMACREPATNENP